MPDEIEDEHIPLAPRMLSQSFGVNQRKFAGEAELRSLMRTQSVIEPQLLGLARTTLLHLAGLLVISWNEMNGLWMGSYGSCDDSSQPAAVF